MRHKPGYAHFNDFHYDSFLQMNELCSLESPQTPEEDLRSEYCDLVRRKNFAGNTYMPTHLKSFYSCQKDLCGEPIFSLYHVDSDQVFEFIRDNEKCNHLLLRYEMYSKNCIPFAEELPFPPECLEQFNILPDSVDFSLFLCENVIPHIDTSKPIDANSNSHPVKSFEVITNENEKSNFPIVIDGAVLDVTTNISKPKTAQLQPEAIQIPNYTREKIEKPLLTSSVPTTPVRPYAASSLTPNRRFLTANQTPLIRENLYLNHRRGEATNANLREEVVKLRIENYQLREALNNLQQQSQQISELTAKLEQQIADNSKLQEDNERLKQLYQDINHQKEALEDEIQKIKQQPITYEQVMEYYTKTPKPQNVSELGWTIMRELFRNAHYHKNHPEYSNESKQFFWVINAQGSTAYSTLRGTLPFPCYNTLNTFIGPLVIKTEYSLLNFKFIPQHIHDFLECYAVKEPIAVTLAIDAIVVKPIKVDILKSTYKKTSTSLFRAYNSQIAFRNEFYKKKRDDIFKQIDKAKTKKKKEKLQKEIDKCNELLKEENILKTQMKDVFIFYLQPHDPRIPCFPIHVWLSDSGAANAMLRQLITTIQILVEQSDLIILKATSTDGDRGHQWLYELALTYILSLSPDLNIDEIICKIRENNSKNLAAADLLHFLKTLRTKLLMSILSLYKDIPEHVFSYDDIQAFITKGKEVYDLSHIGKMRDVYVFKLFSLENINSLIANEKWDAVLFFLPWTLWLTSVTNTLYTPQCRVFMLKVTFEFVKRFYNIMKSKKPQHQDIGINDTKTYVTFVAPAVLDRIIPTLALIISEIEYYIERKSLDPNDPYDYAIDRSGTHPLENLNAAVRNCAHNNDTISSSSHIIARAHIVKTLCKELNLEYVHKTRMNTGGIRLSQCLNLLDQPDLKPDQLVDSIFVNAGAISPETVLQRITDKETNPADLISDKFVNTFIDFLKKAEKLSKEKNTEMKLSTPDSAKNQSIDVRIMNYSNE